VVARHLEGKARWKGARNRRSSQRMGTGRPGGKARKTVAICQPASECYSTVTVRFTPFRMLNGSSYVSVHVPDAAWIAHADPTSSSAIAPFLQPTTVFRPHCFALASDQNKHFLAPGMPKGFIRQKCLKRRSKRSLRSGLGGNPVYWVLIMCWRQLDAWREVTDRPMSSVEHGGLRPDLPIDGPWRTEHGPQSATSRPVRRAHPGALYTTLTTYTQFSHAQKFTGPVMAARILLFVCKYSSSKTIEAVSPFYEIPFASSKFRRFLFDISSLLFSAKGIPYLKIMGSSLRKARWQFGGVSDKNKFRSSGNLRIWCPDGVFSTCRGQGESAEKMR
jgi:hypothetical protein